MSAQMKILLFTIYRNQQLMGVFFALVCTNVSVFLFNVLIIRTRSPEVESADYFFACPSCELFLLELWFDEMGVDRCSLPFFADFDSARCCSKFY